jgi:hypothetical protein
MLKERALAHLGRNGEPDRVGVIMAWAMLRPDPLAAFGTILHWSGRAEGWMVFSAAASRRDRVLAARGAAACMDRLQLHPAFRRIEMWVAADQPWTPAFARALGMTEEGRARSWDLRGRDHLLFARIAA